MTKRLLRKVYRERRRAAFVALLIYAALRTAGIEPGYLPIPLAALAAGALAAAGAVLVPPLRGYMEAIALTGLGFAALARAWPGSAIDLAGSAGEPFVVGAVWLGLTAVARGMRRTFVTLPWPRLHAPRFRARAGSPVDIYRLWYGLVPTPGMEARYGDPDLVAIRDAAASLGRVRLVTQAAPEPPREVMLQILELEAPFHVRLRAQQEGPGGRIVSTGISEIFLVELGRRRLVLFSHEFPNMPLGRALLVWLDDGPGRKLDRRLETIERRARAEDTDPIIAAVAGARASGDGIPGDATANAIAAAGRGTPAPGAPSEPTILKRAF